MSPRSRHTQEASEAEVLVLKSPRYGSRRSSPLPYRIDLLAEHGFVPTWTDRNLDGRWRRLAELTEPRTAPWVQTLLTRRTRRSVGAVVAMFESEGHGLALWRRLTRRRDAPPLVIIGCWLADLVRAGGRRVALYRWLYRAVDGVIVFSSNQRRTLVDGLGLDPERVHVVTFGVDLDELYAVPTSESGTVVAAGRDLGRDWPTLFEAVGGTGWDVPLLTRPTQVEGLVRPAEIDFRATVDRAGYLELLGRATVVVVPTHVREYPTGQTVLLEAMALGKACVATDTPAMREYVDHDVTGWLVPPGDAAALRDAVSELLADPSLRDRIGAAARERSVTDGGASAMWRAVAGVITEARGGVRTTPGT